MKILINCFFFFFFFFFSCKKEDASFDLLKQAKSIADIKPLEALVLLDSIQNPESMDKDNYMQYITAYVQAKYKAQQEITNDTLIFDAQKYFNSIDNTQEAILANYYSDCVYRDKKMINESLESFLNSSYYTIKTGNNQMSAKIFDNIGALYFQQGLIDSATVNYQTALNYYQNLDDTISVLRVTNLIGRSFEAINKFDSAYIYFNNALQIAEIQNNNQYKSIILQNIALTYFGMQKYEKAIEYYQLALNIEETTEKQISQINLYLLKIYNIKGDSNSAKEYASRVEKSTTKVDYIYTLKEMYSALADYNKQIGDYKQALYYANLENEINQKILEQERPLSLLAADKNFYLDQKDKQIDQLHKHIFLYLSIATVVCLVLLIFSISIFKIHKRDKKEIKLQEEKYRRIKDQLLVMAAEYKDIEAEIEAILDED